MNNNLTQSKWEEHSEPYLDIFNVLPVPAVLLASNSPLLTIIDVNKAFVSMVGAVEGELIGESFFNAFVSRTGLSKNKWTELIDRAILERSPIETPPITFNDHRNASDHYVIRPIHLRGNIVPILKQEGGISRLVCSFTDVTEFNSSELVEGFDATRNAKLLEEAHRVARIGSWEANLVDGTLLWSDLTREIYEVDPDFAPSFDIFSSFFPENAALDAFEALVVNAMADQVPD